MKRATIKTMLKTLSTAFPEIEFNVTQERRGMRLISWKGGPHAFAIRQAIPYGGMANKVNFYRKPTDEEQAAQWAQWDREAAERLAAEPARRAAAKAAGIAQAKETRERKAALHATLAARWPDVAFNVSHSTYAFRVEWTGGPDAKAVSHVCGVSEGACTRHDSPEDIAERARLAAWERDAPLRALRAKIARLYTLDTPRPFGARRATQLGLPMRAPRNYATIAEESRMVQAFRKYRTGDY